MKTVRYCTVLLTGVPSIAGLLQFVSAILGFALACHSILLMLL
jgi:hypothetical protein